MQLILDLGNTFCKIAVFNQQELQVKLVVTRAELVFNMEKLINRYSIQRAIISSVIHHSEEVIQKLQSLSTLIQLNHKTPLPISIAYETPETLGIDRLANAVALGTIYPDTPALSIDMGTCIKYDFVDQYKTYQGGAISPGLDMRYKSLHHFTDQLPQLKFSQNFTLTGKTTQESMTSGVQQGILAEVNGIIEKYRSKYPHLKVILTGGDHLHFAEAFKNSIFARPNLTLEGLNEVLKFNE